MVKICIERTLADYGFTATDSDGKTAQFDTSPDEGGLKYGVRPMQSILMALGSCSGIDIVSILKKKRVAFSGLYIEITGEREKDVVPALWEKVHVIFTLKGTSEFEKAEHAVSLSINKYCSVAETLRRAGCIITWKVMVQE
ncbi:MAG: osmotically inducible protein OsmC [Chitinophagaceae bacterium]|nr:osmotically inducible protein OsmC [Chitinophagaceae bacterium]